MDNSTSNSFNKIANLLSNYGSCFALGISMLIGWKLHKIRPDLLQRLTYDYKLTLIVPNDVNFWSKANILKHTMSASILACKNVSKNSRLEYLLWTLTGQRKVVVKADANSSFEMICEDAQKNNICNSLIKDRNRNVALALGPAPSKVLDKLTGSFRLY